MGNCVSLNCQNVSDTVLPNAICFFVIKNGEVSPIQILDLYSHPFQYIEDILVIYEPILNKTSPNSQFLPRPLKLNSFTNVLKSTCKFYNVTHLEYNLFMFSRHDFDVASYKDIKFDNYMSVTSVYHSDIFLDSSKFGCVHDVFSNPSVMERRLKKSQSLIGPTLVLDTNLPITDNSKASDTAMARRSLDKVIDGLYIGDENGSRDLNLLLKNHITHIVNLNGKRLPVLYPDIFEYMVINIYDSEFEVLGTDFEEALVFAHEAIESSGSVFVHCRLGISRSAAFCVAYLMKYCALTFDAAMSQLKECHPLARINDGFIRQLKGREAIPSAHIC